MSLVTAAHDPLAPLAAIRAADGVALVVLLAFTWWGARKGALRQALSVGLLAAAFWAAGRFAPQLEPTLGKLFPLTPGEQHALAWSGVLLGVLVAGGLLLRFLTHKLPERSRGGADRVFGGLLGAAKGAVVMTVAGYALLAFGSVPTGPALSRPAGDAAPAHEERDLADHVRGSLSADCLAEWSGLLRSWVVVPDWVAERMDEVDQRIRGPVGEPEDARRPRGRVGP